MRRLLPLLGLALPAVLLGACSDEPTVVDAGSTASPTQAGSDADGATATQRPDEAAATQRPDEAAATEQDGAPSRTERRAAGRARDWLVAFVRGEEEVCDYMLDLSGERPMTESAGDHAICVEMVPPLAQEQFDEETARVIELVEITGADVDGDRAVITREHFSELFAEGLGDQRIELRRVDGAWYVDLENSF
ncbi:hypothetical protein [Ornithinicoccus halotolerans]|uniref:hypothetical protein n=1 Tax=Ornithinicoccus halotolerans TaxID=1748220 RepID=UPI001295D52C|nr:hypothetical protein [Ornithinicoccus halotolerans]